MTSPAAAFQTAQEAALRATAVEAALAAAMALSSARIYVGAPPQAGPGAASPKLPYLVLGDDQLVDWFRGRDCPDEAELVATVHAWAKTAAQARAILGAALEALNDEQLAIAGWDVDEAELERETYVTDPDGSTHGVAAVRYLLTEQIESEA